MNRLLAILVVWVCGCLGVCSAMIHPGGPRDGASMLYAVQYQFATPVDFIIYNGGSGNVSTQNLTSGSVGLTGPFASYSGAAALLNPNTNINFTASPLATPARPWRVGRTIPDSFAAGTFSVTVSNTDNPFVMYFPTSPGSNASFGSFVTVSNNNTSANFANHDTFQIESQSGTLFGVRQLRVDGWATNSSKWRSHGSGSPGTGNFLSVAQSSTNIVWAAMVIDASPTAPNNGEFRISFYTPAGVFMTNSVTTNIGKNSIYDVQVLKLYTHATQTEFRPAKVCSSWIVGKFGSTNVITPF